MHSIRALRLIAKKSQSAKCQNIDQLELQSWSFASHNRKVLNIVMEESQYIELAHSLVYNCFEATFRNILVKKPLEPSSKRWLQTKLCMMDSGTERNHSISPSKSRKCMEYIIIWLCITLYPQTRLKTYSHLSLRKQAMHTNKTNSRSLLRTQNGVKHENNPSKNSLSDSETF